MERLYWFNLNSEQGFDMVESEEIDPAVRIELNAKHYAERVGKSKPDIRFQDFSKRSPFQLITDELVWRIDDAAKKGDVALLRRLAQALIHVVAVAELHGGETNA